MSATRMAAQAGKGLKNAGKAAHKTKNVLTDPSPTQIIMLIVSLVMSLPAAFILAFIVLVAIIVLALVGASSSGTPSDPMTNSSLLPSGSGDIASALVGGDGKGTFAENAIPRSDLVDPIKEAAKTCDLISPVIIAAQIDYASQFNPDKVGPNGEQGVSQLPPDVFTKYGKDDDNNGKVSALDAKDSIFAQARYLCALGDDIKQLLDAKQIVGDRLTLTLWAYDIGLAAVEQAGGMALPDFSSYPFQVRTLFQKYVQNPGSGPSGQSTPGSSTISTAQFEQMFPSRNSLYTYDGLVAAMAKFPAFAATGDDATRKRETAAFLGNVYHESGGLVYVEEINQSQWGNYCDSSQPYGCPAGQNAYHGRGPIQLSWNTNYKAAGDALGIDLLNNPDLVKNDTTVAWQTALWFWMTQSGAGSTTPHAAITSGAGFGETIRSINGALECDGRSPSLVQDRVSAYQKISGILGVDPGDKLSC